MKVIWSILCQSSAVDRDTNSLSLFNIIEEVTFPAQPPQIQPEQPLPERIMLANFELVTLWMRSNLEVPERGRGRLRIVLTEGQEVTFQEFEVDLTQYLRFRTRVRLPGFPTGGPGIYRFIVDRKTDASEWTEMFELPIRVVLQPQDSG